MTAAPALHSLDSLDKLIGMRSARRKAQVECRAELIARLHALE